MPNWCSTNYLVEGDEAQLNELYNTMNELATAEESLVENGFGKTWCGNLVAKLGGDWNEVWCRGYWDCPDLSTIPYKDGSKRKGLCFWVESAWRELSEWRHFLNEKFPGLQFYYVSEELGCEVFETNDIDHHFFAEKYIVDLGDGSEYYKCDESSELVDRVKEALGRDDLHTVKDCIDAIKNDKDNDYSIRIVQYVKD